MRYLIRTVGDHLAVVPVFDDQARAAERRGEHHIYRTRRQAYAVLRRLQRVTDADQDTNQT